MKKIIDILIKLGGCIFWLVIALWFFNRATAQVGLSDYKIDLRKAVGWAACGVSGSLHGAREFHLYHPERFLNVIGTDAKWFDYRTSWQIKHETGLPTVISDFNHASKAMEAVTMTVGVTITLAGRKQLWQHDAADALIAFSIRTLAAGLTYEAFNQLSK